MVASAVAAMPQMEQRTRKQEHEWQIAEYVQPVLE
jgi:hypothetical protein